MMLQLMYPAVENALNLSRAEVVSIYSFKSATAAIVAFAAGFLIDRCGVKPILYICATMTGLGFIFFHFVDGKWMWWLAGIPLGFSSIPLLLATKTLVARWFNRRLGLALGLAASATSISGMVFPVFFAWLIETFGWNNGLPLMSLPILFVVFPVVYYVVKDSPTQEEVSREFGNEAANPRTFVKGRLIEESGDETRPSFSNILNKPVFWALCGVQFAIGFVDQGFTQNVTPFFVKDLFRLALRPVFTQGYFLLLRNDRHVYLTGLRNTGNGHLGNLPISKGIRSWGRPHGRTSSRETYLRPGSSRKNPRHVQLHNSAWINDRTDHSRLALWTGR